MSNVLTKAKEIRKEGEPWDEAVQRATKMLRSSDEPKEEKSADPDEPKEIDWRDKTTPIS